jgi:hypothetical protein
MLKLDGVLRANTPAISAPGAPAHIVQQRSFVGRVLNVDGIGRTILQASQAAIALFIYLEIDHLQSPDFAGILHGPFILQVRGIHVYERPGFTKMNALRISFAQVALENHVTVPVEHGGTIRTSCQTHLTRDTNVIIDDDPPQFFISGYGLIRTNRLAGGIGAVLTRNRQIYIFAFPLQHAYSGKGWIDFSEMK